MNVPAAQDSSIRGRHLDLLKLAMIPLASQRRSFFTMPQRPPLQLETAFTHHYARDPCEDKIQPTKSQPHLYQSAHDGMTEVGWPMFREQQDIWFGSWHRRLTSSHFSRLPIFGIRCNHDNFGSRHSG
jgi:hypothetical protein